MKIKHMHEFNKESLKEIRKTSEVKDSPLPI